MRTCLVFFFLLKMKGLSFIFLSIGASALSMGRPSVNNLSRRELIFTDANCPGELTDPFEFPHLIIPVNASDPDNAPGTSYNGQVSSDISSIFNFDFPITDESLTCSLVFHFPSVENKPADHYTFAGEGPVSFAALKEPASLSTTFNNAPEVETEFSVFTLTPGTSFVIRSFQCPAGQKVAFRMSSTGSTQLNYFQDSRASP